MYAPVTTVRAALAAVLVLLGLPGPAEALGIARDAAVEGFTVHGVLVSDGGKPNSELRVVNHTDAPAVFVLERDGLLLAREDLPPLQATYVRVVLPEAYRDVKVTQHWRYVIEAPSGPVVGQVPLAAGWGVQINTPLPFANCTTVTWHYDASRAPKWSRSVPRDIEDALEVLERHTGLTFRQAADPGRAGMLFGWEDRYPLDSNVAATASRSVDGVPTVTLYAQSRALRAVPPGLAASVSRPNSSGYVTVTAGRSWTLVHEVMHLLGFEHSERADSVMYPYVYRHAVPEDDLPRRPERLVTSRLASGDVQGLRYLFPRAACGA